MESVEQTGEPTRSAGRNNCSPAQWLRRLRCRLAKELISRGYSSKAVAAELKFATNSHFCREFKKVFGASPQQFAPNHFRHMSICGLTGDGSSPDSRITPLVGPV